MIISTAFDTLADRCSSHIRIHTAIVENKITRATNLLLARMEGMMRDYNEGDILEDDTLLAACSIIDSMNGPRINIEMHAAAGREINRIRHA
jgi:hypothetical protein